MVDYAAVLRDLRQKRDQLAELITRIEAFAPPAPKAAMTNGSATGEFELQPIDPRKIPLRPRKKPAAPAAKGDAKTRALELAKGGDFSVQKIADTVGKPYGTVYGWLKGRGKPAKKAPADAPARRMCQECHQKGISDPCEHCGEAR